MRAQRFAMIFLGLIAGSASFAGQTPPPAENAASHSPSAQVNGGFSFFVPGAIEDSNDTEAVQTFLRASGSNFMARDSKTAFSYSNGGCVQRDSTAGDGWFTLDLQIPNGSVIDYMRAYYFDNDASIDVNTELWAFDGEGGTTLIAEADSMGSPGFGSAGSDFFSYVVNTGGESLAVLAYIPGGAGSNLKFCGIRIRYQAPITDRIFSDGFDG